MVIKWSLLIISKLFGGFSHIYLAIGSAFCFSWMLLPFDSDLYCVTKTNHLLILNGHLQLPFLQIYSSKLVIIPVKYFGIIYNLNVFVNHYKFFSGFYSPP